MCCSLLLPSALFYIGQIFQLIELFCEQRSRLGMLYYMYCYIETFWAMVCVIDEVVNPLTPGD